jgi:hypothetical protein
MSSGRGSQTLTTNAEPLSVTPKVGSDVAAVRRGVGYATLAGALVSAVCFLRYAFHHVDSLAAGPTPLFDYVKLGVHGVLSLAGVFLIYTVFQAAERLILPLELVRNSEDLKLLLGVKHPATASMEELNKALSSVKEIVKEAKPGGGH